MSEPDNSPWLRALADELRAEEAVRPAWRARLLDEIARSPRPRPGDPDVRDLPPIGAATGEHGATTDVLRPKRRLTLHPLAAIAAALVFAALGAGAALTILPARGPDAVDSMAAAARSGAAKEAGAIALPVADATSDRALVRFELSAPAASRVALVGSFNRWNPAATPLERDPATGKWMVALQLPPGRHVYAFVVDGDVTADPAAPRAADADFGTPNSVVLVSGRSS
ncbi:MAG TPA: hypothetical protein VFZ21_20460 [Gemmatimonadaceae bacterium]|nr:hypothetical protein [Gemmatimonadaceae bacterium]